jgi:glycosyltransferase involved in cell wall biosynthesis
MENERLVGYDATPLEGKPSGVGHYAWQLLTHALQESDVWRFQLLANRPLNGHLKDVPLALPVSGPYFPVRSVWMQGLLPLSLRKAQPTLCHFTNYLMPLALPCPALVTVHDMSPFLYPETQPRKNVLLMRALLPQIARRADTIITVTQSAADDIRRVLKLSKGKVRVVYEAASSLFQPVTAPDVLARVRRTYHLEHPYILYIGTIEPRKNLDRLVEAFAQVKQRGLPHQLRLVGSWGWKYESLVRRIEELGIQDDVIFDGYAPDEDLPALYTLADVFAFPSLYEGFGLPVLEAMRCGTPVVAADIPALAEIAGDAALLIDPYDAEQLGDALALVLRNDNRAEELRERGLVRAAQFSWRRAARETLRLYDEVVNRHTLPAERPARTWPTGKEQPQPERVAIGED